MKVTKPHWVEHTVGDKKSKCPIYSISVHPDGTRLATGGLDHKVKIWSTLPILDEEAEKDDQNPKLLCTMAAHTGSVLSVRWAHHGRFLATGSDDQVIMIWGINPDGGGRLWGSDEVNVENWKALTRLVGHVADVVDLAWSRDDSMLASVGLDSTVWIWDGLTFERLRKLDLHQGFVKGVCWDPVGNYLATQSDDKTVKIWDTEDWALVETISKPFETSPQSTFFRRLSWSPDGAFIAASNAMNGPVFVAAVIDREGWSSDISFVGHENTIQVAAFNPRLFFKEGEPIGRATASTMLALGANDFSISIWRNTLHKPLVVLKDVFGADLMDMCWSNDGYSLYGSSVDGSICAINFDPSEFTERADADATDLVLEEYNYHHPKRSTQTLAAHPSAPSVSHSFGAAQTTSTHVNVLQPKKGKAKRRVDLSNGSRPPSSQGGRPPLQPPFLPPARTDPFSAPIQGFASPSTTQASTARMFQDVHHAFGAANGNGGSPKAGDKRKASAYGDDVGVGMGRVMSGSQIPMRNVEVIRAPMTAPSQSQGAGPSSAMLPHPQVQSLLRATTPTNSVYLEARNAPDVGGVNHVAYFRDDKQQWVDYVPTAILAVVVTTTFCAAACEDQSVRVYSPAGRLIANVRLGALVHDLKANENMVMVMTVDCQVRVINARTCKQMFPATSFQHLLQSTTTSTSDFLSLVSTSLRPNGAPTLITSEPHAYIYDTSLSAWCSVCPPTLSLSSLRPLDSLGGPLTEIEKIVLDSSPDSNTSLSPNNDVNLASPWWTESQTMAHYETKLRGARLLESEEEWMYWLEQYLKYLGDENFLDRAEEVVKDLIGPVYNQTTPTGWESTIFEMPKRVIAINVLDVLAKTQHGAAMAEAYADILKKIRGHKALW